jgi:cytochrome P450
MAESAQRPEYDFDFHGDALDTIFDDYRVMRAECPVSWSTRYGGFWSITSYDDVHAAEHDWDTYSVAPSMILPSFGTDRPLIPLDIDPPNLVDYRKTLLPFFTPQKMDGLIPRTREIARQLLDDTHDQATFDASTYARMLPTMIFCEYAGFPIEDAAQLDQWVELIVFARTDDESVARNAAEEVYKYFRSLIRKRRQQRKDDVVSGLLDMPFHGRPLTDDEMLDTCYLLFVAGLETTASTIRSSLWHLAQHPADLAMLAASPTAIATATEEFLRTLSPVQAMARTLKQDTTVRGIPMCVGERVALVFGAANRDPQRFVDPDEIRLDRPENPHVAFGIGAHRCLGSNLARREVNVALEELITRYPKFELAEPAPWHGIGPLILKEAI